MGGGAESINAERFGAHPRLARSGHPIAAPADQASAKKRRDFGIIQSFRQREAVARIGDGMRGIATIARIAGEQRLIAEILATAPAIGAAAARIAEPGHAHALADREPRCPFAHCGDATDYFVPRHDRQFGMRQLAVHHMQVGATNAAGRDLDENFTGSRLRDRPLAHDERRARLMQHHGAHGHAATLARMERSDIRS